MLITWREPLARVEHYISVSWFRCVFPARCVCDFVCIDTCVWLRVRKLTDPALPSWATRLCCNSIQGPIDYTLYEAYGGGAGKAVSAVLNNARATRIAIGVLATMVVRAVMMGYFWKSVFDAFYPASCRDDQAIYHDCKRHFSMK